METADAYLTPHHDVEIASAYPVTIGAVDVRVRAVDARPAPPSPGAAELIPPAVDGCPSVVRRVGQRGLLAAAVGAVSVIGPWLGGSLTVARCGGHLYTVVERCCSAVEAGRRSAR
jgi:hypothetical protein